MDVDQVIDVYTDNKFSMYRQWTLYVQTMNFVCIDNDRCMYRQWIVYVHTMICVCKDTDLCT